MATHQISMLGAQVVPDGTGRCWFESYATFATNDVWRHNVVRFLNPASGEAHGIYGQFTVPQNYVSAAQVVPVWTSTATTGNCRWRLTYRTVAGDNANSLDQTSNEQQVSLTDAAPGAAHRRLAPSPGLTPTAANFAAGETVEYLFERLDDTGTDTMAADAVLHDLLFSYADA
jgi:hypothetical protein